MKRHLLLIFSLACFLFACKPDPVVPTVKTTAATEITENSAKSGGEITADGGADITSRGVCWSKNQNPTINDYRTDDGSGIGIFNSTISDLEDSTTYFVKAYAINTAGIAYGEELSFTTLAINDDDNDDDDADILLPTVTTLSIDSITYNSAVAGGNVKDDGGTEVTTRGVCWSTEQNPTIDDNHTSDGKGKGEYVSSLTELESNTKYYVRAFATNSIGTAYGNEVSFTTEDPYEDETTINGYEYVDLGLPSGIKWATHNVGATTPSEAGNYYAWGEIVTKSEYTEANCTTYQLNMEDISGNPQYDAARSEWGASWRMPTKEEFEELLNNCTWEWEVLNGTGCKKVTGPNGNYIYLPISGYKYGSSIYMESFGYYWTSTPITTYENFSYDFLFDMELNLTMGFDDRCGGQPIRPVSN